MSTTSARPDHLLGYSGALCGRVAVAENASIHAAMVLTVYRTACADQPLTEHPSRLVDAALDGVRSLLGTVRHVAWAFIAADALRISAQSGQTPAGAAGVSEALGRVVRRVDHLGRRWEAEVSRQTGPAHVSGEAEAFAGIANDRWWGRHGDGWAAGFTAFAGARTEAHGTAEAGVLSGRAAADASVGAEASADASVQVTRDQIEIDAAGGAFIGAKAGASIEAEAMGVGYEAAVEGRVGFGVDGSADVDLGWDEVGIDLSGGVAFIVGAGGRAGFRFDPKETSNDLVRLGIDRHKKLEEAVTDLRHEVEDEVVELVGRAPAATEDLVRSGIDLLTDPGQIADNPLDRFGTGTVRSPLTAPIPTRGG